MASPWPLTFSSGERPRALWALLLHYLLVNLRYKYSNIYLTHSHHQVSNLGPSAVKTALLRIEWPGEDEFGHSYLRLDDMPIASRPDISCELLNNTVSQPTDYIFICIYFPAIFCSKINPRSAVLITRKLELNTVSYYKFVSYLQIVDISCYPVQNSCMLHYRYFVI